jgi:hypothetical protein
MIFVEPLINTVDGSITCSPNTTEADPDALADVTDDVKNKPEEPPLLENVAGINPTNKDVATPVKDKFLEKAAKPVPNTDPTPPIVAVLAMTAANRQEPNPDDKTLETSGIIPFSDVDACPDD